MSAWLRLFACRARRARDRRRRRRRLEEALGGLERFAGLPDKVRSAYDERADAIRAAFQAGASISEIARRLETDRRNVYDALQRAGEVSR